MSDQVFSAGVVSAGSTTVQESLTASNINGVSDAETRMLSGAKENIQEQIDQVREKAGKIDVNQMNGVRVVATTCPGTLGASGDITYFLLFDVTDWWNSEEDSAFCRGFTGFLYSVGDLPDVGADTSGMLAGGNIACQLHVGVSAHKVEEPDVEKRFFVLDSGHERYAPCIIHRTEDDTYHLALMVSANLPHQLKFQGVFSPSFDTFEGTWITPDQTAAEFYDNAEYAEFSQDENERWLPAGYEMACDKWSYIGVRGGSSGGVGGGFVLGNEPSDVVGAMWYE